MVKESTKASMIQAEWAKVKEVVQVGKEAKDSQSLKSSYEPL